jgi:pyrimidine operon attenuation protein / uracil phosphoribosyltransferase
LVGIAWQHFCIFAHMPDKVQILSAQQIEAKLTRMAYEIVEQNFTEQELFILGIQGRGVDIATKLQKLIESISQIAVHLSILHINKENPIEVSLQSDLDLRGKSVVLVDDVVNSGRTLLYACTPLLHTVLKKLQVAVLVDRRHKSYPVSADFVGTSVATTLKEHISVEVQKGKVVGAFLS